MSTNIGLARKQRVFVVEETTEGTLQYPSAANFVRPAGNAVMNQNPAFSDSEELLDTLDIVNRFESARPAGEFTLPMYIRPSGTIGSAPQGGILFESMQGSLSAAAASLSANISSGATSLTYDTRAGGNFPSKGVITIGTEQIYYTTKSQAASGTSGTLSGLTRGYNSTSAATHATNDSVSLTSVFYEQATTSPSFSLWIESDHFIQAMTGCSVTNASLPLANEGGVKMTFNGQGMYMYWAGKDALTTNASSAATQLSVTDADRFSVTARIQNYTKSATNTTGYVITRVDTDNNIIVISPATGSAWATGDVIKGYLPTGTVTGSVVEAKNTSVTLNSVSATIKNSELTFDVPKQYLTDEVGTTYPTSYIEDVRSITANLSVYFRQADAKYFNEGYSSGSEIPVEFTFGSTVAYKMRVYMKKTKLEVPTINFNVPAIELSIPMKALGTNGEDSCEVVFE